MTCMSWDRCPEECLWRMVPVMGSSELTYWESLQIYLIFLVWLYILPATLYLGNSPWALLSLSSFRLLASHPGWESLYNQCRKGRKPQKRIQCKCPSADHSESSEFCFAAGMSSLQPSCISLWWWNLWNLWYEIYIGYYYEYSHS